jgi:hypothetical protein
MPRVNIRIGYFLFLLLVLWQGAFAEFNPVRYFKAGGPVMWPILLASILVIAVALERIRTTRKRPWTTCSPSAKSAAGPWPVSSSKA